MIESINNNLNNNNNLLEKKYDEYLEMRKKIGRYIERIYDDVIKDVIRNSKNPELNINETIFIRHVKDNIIALVPRARVNFREIDGALEFSKGKDVLIDGAVEITIQILSRYLSLEEIEDKLKELGYEKNRV